MDKNSKVYEFLKTFIMFKKSHIGGIIKFKSDNTQNENIALVIISEKTSEESLINDILNNKVKDNKLHLNKLREIMDLAPSTITPIITSLEEKGYVLRNIDKEDRRNIYISLTKKGEEYTLNMLKGLLDNLNEYIKFMGIEDTNEFIRLINKTNEYTKSRSKKIERKDF